MNVEDCLGWRFVRDPCSRCKGRGVHSYGSSAGWRGGVSCTMPLVDVCDLCWGTGDALRPGTNLRLMWARKQEAEARVVVLELELKEARA